MPSPWFISEQNSDKYGEGIFFIFFSFRSSLFSGIMLSVFFVKTREVFCFFFVAEEDEQYVTVAAVGVDGHAGIKKSFFFVCFFLIIVIF